LQSVPAEHPLIDSAQRNAVNIRQSRCEFFVLRLSITPKTHLDVTDAPHTDPREATADRVPSDRPLRSKPTAAVETRTHRTPAVPGLTRAGNLKTC